MDALHKLKTKIFADGANKETMLQLSQQPWVKGFTTNPSLMRKAGINNYQEFALDILDVLPNLPISFEVFADDLEQMYQQALHIAAWGEHVYVKIPVTNTLGEPTYQLIKRLAERNIKMNVTAIMTLDQVFDVADALCKTSSSFISVFAGRIADTGRDPLPIIKQALEIMRPYPNLELIWASTRELFNIFQAESLGCHIITVQNDLLEKAAVIGKDLNQYSLETVKTFHEDATHAGFSLETL